MPSIVASAFRDRVAASLPPDHADMLDSARGGGPEFREMHRALMMADKAIREWAAAALAEKRPGAPNRFDLLGTLGRPEDHHSDARPAADEEVRAAQTREEAAVARAVQSLADAVTDLDTEATLSSNTSAMRATAEAAADVLTAASAIHGGHDYVVAQTNELLHDLVSLAGWQNHLGPRFQ